MNGGGERSGLRKDDGEAFSLFLSSVRLFPLSLWRYTTIERITQANALVDVNHSALTDRNAKEKRVGRKGEGLRE